MLAPRLRQADLDEIDAATGESPIAALERGLRHSTRCYAVVVGPGTVAALFGVVPGDTPSDGIAWLLAAGELLTVSRAFIRHSRFWVDQLQSGYQRLWNYVDARNHAHQRWLHWCGFVRTGESTEWGRDGALFYLYERRRP